MNEIIFKLNRLQKISLPVGIIFLILSGVGAAFDARHFFISWLAAFSFWLGLSLGCFAAAMIHYLTGGRWGFPARRFLEAGFMTLPLMAIFLIPIFFGLHELYPWARPETVATDKILQVKIHYENPVWFIVRAVFFFGIWIFIATLLRKWSLQQDATGDVTATIKIRALSGPAVAIVPLTASFAFIDWAMSIEADWYSTVFPVIILIGQLLLALAFITVLLGWMRNDAPFCDAGEKTFRDLASLLLALVMFWTYVAFAQILIIYSGNLPHEISWFLHRIRGGWLWLVAFIALFHFFAPFFLLLFRRVKNNVRLLATIAVFIFILHAAEMFWVIAPTFYPRLEIHWTDFAAWPGIGGLWLAVFSANLKRHPLLARNDPRLENLTAQAANAK